MNPTVKRARFKILQKYSQSYKDHTIKGNRFKWEIK